MLSAQLSSFSDIVTFEAPPTVAVLSSDDRKLA